MQLFVANLTKQDHDFVYRTKSDKNRTKVQLIPTGQQRQIFTNAEHEDLDHIVKQHSPYGMLPEKEVLPGRTFVGLCYSFDKPVNLERFMVAEERNSSALVQLGVDVRSLQAAAIDSAIDDNAGSATVNRLEVQTVQEVPRGGTLDTPRLEETIAVETAARETARETAPSIPKALRGRRRG